MKRISLFTAFALLISFQSALASEALTDAGIHAGVELGTGIGVGTLAWGLSSSAIAGSNGVYKVGKRVVTGAWPTTHLIQKPLAEKIAKGTGAVAAVGSLAACSTVSYRFLEDPVPNHLTCATIAAAAVAFPGVITDRWRYKNPVTIWSAGAALAAYAVTEGIYAKRRFNGDPSPNEAFISNLVRAVPSGAGALE